MAAKRCKACGAEFQPFNTLQRACTVACAITLSREGIRRKRRIEVRKGRIALRSRRDWVKLAQAAFNAYIRARDKNQPCISCDRNTEAKQNAGHFRSVGAAPHLRFDEANCHKQCEHCNSYKSANIEGYRPRLIRKIGQAEVDRIENDNRIHRHTVEELKTVIQTYRAKLKEFR